MGGLWGCREGPSRLPVKNELVSDGTDEGDTITLKLSSIGVTVNHGGFITTGYWTGNIANEVQNKSSCCHIEVPRVTSLCHICCCLSTHYDWLMLPFK